MARHKNAHDVIIANQIISIIKGLIELFDEDMDDTETVLTSICLTFSETDDKNPITVNEMNNFFKLMVVYQNTLNNHKHIYYS